MYRDHGLSFSTISVNQEAESKSWSTKPIKRAQSLVLKKLGYCIGEKWNAREFVHKGQISTVEWLGSWRFERLIDFLTTELQLKKQTSERAMKLRVISHQLQEWFPTSFPWALFLRYQLQYESRMTEPFPGLPPTCDRQELQWSAWGGYLAPLWPPEPWKQRDPLLVHAFWPFLWDQHQRRKFLVIESKEKFKTIPEPTIFCEQPCISPDKVCDWRNGNSSSYNTNKKSQTLITIDWYWPIRDKWK